jgi:hypothetical protein
MSTHASELEILENGTFPLTSKHGNMSKLGSTPISTNYTAASPSPPKTNTRYTTTLPTPYVYTLKDTQQYPLPRKSTMHTCNLSKTIFWAMKPSKYPPEPELPHGKPPPALFTLWTSPSPPETNTRYTTTLPTPYVYTLADTRQSSRIPPLLRRHLQSKIRSYQTSPNLRRQSLE